jgi:hypothetical protein
MWRRVYISTTFLSFLFLPLEPKIILSIHLLLFLNETKRKKRRNGVCNREEEVVERERALL